MLTDLDARSPFACNSKTLFRSRYSIEIISQLLSSGASLGKINLPLEEFMQHLENHLVHDLGDDFYEELVFTNPWLTRASESLRQLQTEVQTSLYQLRRAANMGDQSQPPTNDFRKHFDHFIAIFLEHEAGIQMYRQCGSSAY